MLTKSQLRKEIERRSSNLTDEQIFGSSAFTELLQAFITACCRNKERIPVLTNQYAPHSSTTAYTNGDHVVVNSGSELITALPDLWKRYVGTCGFSCHESGHVLFTDFVTGTAQIKAWNSLTWYPKPLVKTNKTLKDIPSRAQRVFLQECGNIQNIMEDIYIENMLYSEFDGLATLGLQYLNEVMFNESNSLEELLEMCAEGKITKESVVMALMMHRKTGHEIKQSGAELSPDAAAIEEEILNATDDVYKIIDEFEFEGNPIVRASKIQDVVIRLMDLLPDEEEENGQNQQSQSGNGSSGSQSGSNNQQSSSGSGGKTGNESNSSNGNNQQNGNSKNNKGGNTGSKTSSNNNSNAGSNGQTNSGNGSGNDQQPTAEELIEAIKEMLDKNGATAAPNGNTRPVNDPNDTRSSEEKKEDAKNQKELAEAKLKNSESMQNVLDKALKEIAKQMVEHEEEQAHGKELQEEANDIAKDIVSHTKFGTSGHRGKEFLINRANNVSQYKAQYARVYAEQKKTADHIYRKLNNILKDRQTQDSDSGYLMGTRFNAKDVWHGDGAYFSRPNVPDGQPNVVFGILCDESGSMASYSSDMRRSRTEVVRDTAILLEDVLRRLDIPVSIVGHTSVDSSIVLSPYVDFDTVDENDKYRLCGVDANSCNIDGGAITYMGEKLLKRNETLKIMIVISDGQPCYGSFYSPNPEEDTMKAIEIYRKKGIKILGAMLIQDQDAKNIYGNDACFDCTSPGTLEKELLKCVKKFVLAR